MADELEDLSALKVTPKSGDEPFSLYGQPTGFDLRSFWRWSTSDLIANSIRGVLAEYLVARSLDLDVSSPRDPWAKFDLETRNGIRIEVKSAAAIQTWHQTRLSKPLFKYKETRGWDRKSNKLSDTKSRHADIYVFALLAPTDKPSTDPMKIEQWKFYVVATPSLASRARSQHSITISSLEKECSKGLDTWCGPVGYGRKLAEAITRVAAAGTSAPTADCRP